MQATAHFEPDFHSLISDAKQASLDALMGETPENWKLISAGPRNVAWFDALHYVGTNFPNCDRRRRKREWRKALKRAYAGELPKMMVTITSEPFVWSDVGYQERSPKEFVARLDAPTYYSMAGPIMLPLGGRT